MDKLIKWLINNKEWVFEGIGVMVIVWIGQLIFKKRKMTISQRIKSGNKSKNYQAGHDMSFKQNSKQNNVEKEN